MSQMFLFILFYPSTAIFILLFSISFFPSPWISPKTLHTITTLIEFTKRKKERKWRYWLFLFTSWAYFHISILASISVYVKHFIHKQNYYLKQLDLLFWLLITAPKVPATGMFGNSVRSQNYSTQSCPHFVQTINCIQLCNSTLLLRHGVFPQSPQSKCSLLICTTGLRCPFPLLSIKAKNPLIVLMVLKLKI